MSTVRVVGRWVVTGLMVAWCALLLGLGVAALIGGAKSI